MPFSDEGRLSGAEISHSWQGQSDLRVCPGFRTHCTCGSATATVLGRKADGAQLGHVRLLTRWRTRFQEPKFAEHTGPAAFAHGHAGFFRRAAVEAVGGLVQSGRELPGSSLSLPHQMDHHPCGKKCRQKPLLISADRYGSMGVRVVDRHRRQREAHFRASSNTAFGAASPDNLLESVAANPMPISQSPPAKNAPPPNPTRASIFHCWPQASPGRPAVVHQAEPGCCGR